MSANSPSPTVQIVSKSDIGKRRSENQDSYLFQAATPEMPIDVSLVADGVGGNLPLGQVASQSAVEGFMSNFNGQPLDDDRTLLARCAQALQGAQDSVLTAAEENEVQRIGTTIIGLAIQGDHGVAFNIGDSRLYRLRDGELEQISIDQTRQTGVGVLRNEIEARSSRISSYLGQPRELQPYYYELEIFDGDQYMLCSDGLWSLATVREMRNIMRDSATLEAITTQLINLALERGAPDNVTVSVVQIGAKPRAHEPTDVNQKLATTPAMMTTQAGIAATTSTAMNIPTAPQTVPVPASSNSLPLLLGVGLIALLIGLATGFFVGSSGGDDDSGSSQEVLVITATPEPTSTASDTPIPSDTPLPTDTAMPTVTDEPTATDEPSATPEPTTTVVPTDTVAPPPTETVVAVAQDDPTSTETVVVEATATDAAAAIDAQSEATATQTVTATITSTITSTATFTALPTATETPEPSATASDTPLPTNTVTPVPTDTPIPTATDVPTDTAVPTTAAVADADTGPQLTYAQLVTISRSFYRDDNGRFIFTDLSASPAVYAQNLDTLRTAENFVDENGQPLPNPLGFWQPGDEARVTGRILEGSTVWYEVDLSPRFDEPLLMFFETEQVVPPQPGSLLIYDEPASELLPSGEPLPAEGGRPILGYVDSAETGERWHMIDNSLQPGWVLLTNTEGIDYTQLPQLVTGDVAVPPTIVADDQQPTPTFTQIVQVTETPLPSSTPTLAPTNTLVPTDTLAPTDTPLPTATETPHPTPTDVPTAVDAAPTATTAEDVATEATSTEDDTSDVTVEAATDETTTAVAATTDEATDTATPTPDPTDESTPEPTIVAEDVLELPQNLDCQQGVLFSNYLVENAVSYPVGDGLPFTDRRVYTVVLPTGTQIYTDIRPADAASSLRTALATTPIDILQNPREFRVLEAAEPSFDSATELGRNQSVYRVADAEGNTFVAGVEEQTFISRGIDLNIREAPQADSRVLGQMEASSTTVDIVASAWGPGPNDSIVFWYYVNVRFTAVEGWVASGLGNTSYAIRFIDGQRSDEAIDERVIPRAMVIPATLELGTQWNTRLGTQDWAACGVRQLGFADGGTEQLSYLLPQVDTLTDIPASRRSSVVLGRSRGAYCFELAPDCSSGNFADLETQAVFVILGSAVLEETGETWFYVSVLDDDLQVWVPEADVFANTGEADFLDFVDLQALAERQLADREAEAEQNATEDNGDTSDAGTADELAGPPNSPPPPPNNRGNGGGPPPGQNGR